MGTRWDEHRRFGPELPSRRVPVWRAKPPATCTFAAQRRWTGIEPARATGSLSSILKTEGPTRRPDTSAAQHTAVTCGNRPSQIVHLVCCCPAAEVWADPRRVPSTISALEAPISTAAEAQPSPWRGQPMAASADRDPGPMRVIAAAITADRRRRRRDCRAAAAGWPSGVRLPGARHAPAVACGGRRVIRGRARVRPSGSLGSRAAASPRPYGCWSGWRSRCRVASSSRARTSPRCGGKRCGPCGVGSSWCFLP